jgi:hypothetical protein
MSPLLQQILQEIDQLTPTEQMEVMGYLAERAKQYATPASPKRKISEFAGIAPNLLGGVDAQAWVNQLRTEWGEREAQLRGNHESE